jgi:hypothetical protein
MPIAPLTGVKRPGPEANYSSASTAYLPYVFMAYGLIRHRDNFIAVIEYNCYTLSYTASLFKFQTKLIKNNGGFTLWHKWNISAVFVSD